MASKVLVPTAPFAKLQIKQPAPDQPAPDQTATGFVVTTTDASGRVAHLEHSVRFLQEQHRLMLSGLHAEIEALRERNRDLQFQLIFNKEPSPKTSSPISDEGIEGTEEARLNREVTRLDREAAAARGEARAAEARALHLQRIADAQAVEIRSLSSSKCSCAEDESRGALRVRLAEAERLVRRLRGEAAGARREVHAPSGVTNLLFDDVAARTAHVACMKNCLQAQLRAGTIDLGFHNSYQFPPLPHEYWPRDHRTHEVCGAARPRRPLTLPDLAHAHSSTVYANNHARPRGHFETKKIPPQSNVENISPDADAYIRHNERLKPTIESNRNYPELKVVITKVLPHIYLDAKNPSCGPRPRARRPKNRAPPDH